MLIFCCIQMHIPSQREVLAFIFIFQKVVFLLPPSNKWHHKQTKIMFQITKFTVSDRIYPIECTYIEIEDILLPRQIRRSVKVRAIWWGKEPCSFERQSIYWWNIENWRILILYVLFSFQVDLHLFLPLLNWWENLLCRMKYSCNKFRQMYKAISIRDWILLVVWKTEGPRFNFVMSEALFEIYTWINCLSQYYEKETSRIQSLYLYFTKIVPFFGYEISVFNTQQGGIQNSRRSRRLIRQRNGFTDEWISN